MTYHERMKAFELRLNSMTWDEISEMIGYSPSTIETDLKSCVNGRKRKSSCIYPALRKIIMLDYGGSIRQFATACGVSYGCVYCCLTGRSRPEKSGKQICAFLGITPEQAFGKKDAF